MLNYDIKINKLFFENDVLYLKLKTDYPKILIGKNGQVLFDIQRLLTIILSKSASDKFSLDVDINDYKKKKCDYLKELAETIADDVSLSGTAKEMDPMPSYERRIIHMVLSTREDVKTESVGEGENRKIIIRAKS